MLMRPDPRYIDCPETYPSGTVVLVSGGVDSLINADAHPDAALLFVDFHADAENELRACQDLFGERLQVVTMRPKWPSAEGIFVPARNMMLACHAVQYGSHITL